MRPSGIVLGGRSAHELAVLDPRLPVTGLAGLVRHGKNDDTVALRTLNDRERKVLHRKASSNETHMFQRARRRASANTSSAARSGNSPRSNASTRRSISFAHAASISETGICRDSSKDSTSLARSSGFNARACSSICFNDDVISWLRLAAAWLFGRAHNSDSTRNNRVPLTPRIRGVSAETFRCRWDGAPPDYGAMVQLLDRNSGPAAGE